METFLTKKDRRGTSLVVQWLRICLAMHGMQVQVLDRELRFHKQLTGQLSVRAATPEPTRFGA